MSSIESPTRSAATAACDNGPLIIYYVPGMAGMCRRDERFCEAMADAGADHVHPQQWVTYPKVLQILNLRHQSLHHQAAAQIAERVNQSKSQAPSARHVLIGHSTGARIVLETLKRLDHRVDRAVLLAAAVHRQYDLNPALRRVQRLWSFYSPFDVFFLGLGTTLAQTADGYHRPAAGMAPFTGPGTEDSRLRQHPYTPRWRRCGHLGGHLGWLHPLFARDILMPQVIAASDESPTTR